MSKNNNLITEIQELTQYIKTNYQEGIDFKDLVIKDKKIENFEAGCLKIISSRLKKYCREKFSFPLGVNDYLDYSKEKPHTNGFFYRTSREDRHDYFCLRIDGRPWEYFFSSRKEFEEWKKKNPESHWGNPEEDNPKNCSVCGEIVLLKNGRMRLWNDECRIIGVNEDGYSCKLSKPFTLAHFHPHCAKKYFADKETIKEKKLHNLDKISFDQAGHLANAELLKFPYEYGTQKKEKAGVYRIKIDNEEINLRYFDRLENEKYYLEIRDAIVNNIKQNISDWEIKSDEYNSHYLKNKKTGVKVWKIIFCEIVFENGEQDWAEIEKLLKGYNSPVVNVNNEKTETNNFELEWLKKIFQELKIKKVVFENGKLTIEFNNSQNTSFENGDNQKYKILKNYCQKHNQKEITRGDLKLEEEKDTSTNSNQNKNNHQLVIGLTIGAGAVALLGIIVYFWNRKGKSIKRIN